MSDHEPVVTRTVTITEGPNGISRSWSASVTGGTEWEQTALMRAALADAERASELPFIEARREHWERRSGFQNSNLHALKSNNVQLVTIPNGYGRNLDPNEGA